MTQFTKHLKIILILPIIFFGFFFFVRAANAENLYVTPTGAGLHNGSDWNNTFADLSGTSGVVWGEGVGKLGAGDTLWIAGGTYVKSLIPRANGTAESRLYVKRCTSNDAECTTAAGWNTNYDSQVLMTGNVTAINMYYTGASGVGRYMTVDGRTKDGIRITAGDWTSYAPIYIREIGQEMHTTFRYIGIYGLNTDIYNPYTWAHEVRGIQV